MIAKKSKLVHKSPSFLTLFLLLLLMLFVLASWDLIKRDRQMQNLIYSQVYIDDIPFGGKTRQYVEDWFHRKNQKLDTIQFTFKYKAESVATLSGALIALRYDGKGIADRAFLIGRSPHFSSRIYQKLASILGWQRFKFSSWIDYDTSPIKEIISNLEDKYNKPAKNALFKFENGKVVSFRQEEKGLEIESGSILKDFDNNVVGLNSKVEPIIIHVSSSIIEPEITLAEANGFGIEELIGEGKSNYTHSIPGRIHNVILASSKFNGVLIPRGKTFSFNQEVGDISALTGYQQAYIIKEGKTVLGDGGGVCQVSTTLFRAALNAGLPIVERWPHAYRVSYYENDSKPGFDATVFAPSVDLKIKNDTSASVLIEIEIDKSNMILTFKLFGKKDKRKVEISTPVLYDVQPPPPPRYQDDPTLKKGEIKQVDFAAWGGKAYYNYRVTYPNNHIEEKKIFSAYKPWQAVFLQGTAD